MHMHDKALQLDRVGKRYDEHRALVEVSTNFSPGKVAAVLGPNGAGKSTLLAILSTLSRPSTGKFTFGRPGDDAARAPARHDIGYVGHEPGLYGDLTALQNLTLFASLYGLPDPAGRIDQMLDRVGLKDVRPAAVVRTFSRGMTQRLALARALLHQPKILLFDEPGSALDPAGSEWLSRQIRQERTAGRIVVVVSHDLESVAAVADHVLILRRGRLAFDETRSGGFPIDTLRLLYEERTRGSA